MNTYNPTALTQFSAHLASEIELEARAADFDMNDLPEKQVSSPFANLSTALDWLDSHVTQSWRAADREALRCQLQHRRLARVAIVAGVSAIIIAILQLSIRLTLGIKPFLPHGLSTAGRVFEVIAFIAASIAVVVGLRARFDRRWLSQRLLAERLRMLKFRALEQLWCRNQSSWEAWVVQQVKTLKGADDFDAVKAWSRGGEIEPRVPVPTHPHVNAPFAVVLASYYRSKRLDFQAGYFQRRAEAYERQTGRWRRLTMPMFFAGILCVITTFVIDFFAHYLHLVGSEERLKSLEVLTIWLSTTAAVIPILGLGIRVWFSAFELPHSASLFAAKHQALLRAALFLKQDSGDPLATLNHIAKTEHFLEHEHREWLRLLLDSEWFV